MKASILVVGNTSYTDLCCMILIVNHICHYQFCTQFIATQSTDWRINKTEGDVIYRDVNHNFAILFKNASIFVPLERIFFFSKQAYWYYDYV